MNAAPIPFPDDTLWLSEAPQPKRLCTVDDTLTADAAFRLASEGTALVWRGDFHNARQLLQALGRRMERKGPQLGAGKTVPNGAPADATAIFHRYRMGQAQKARTLGLILLPVEAGYRIPLRRAPEVAEACEQSFGPMGPLPAGGALLPLRELQGVIGAYEWRRKGVPVAALGASIHPHYGVFAPVRGEYVELVAQAPLPQVCRRAFDIGTGTGVLAAVLARRGIQDIIATDSSTRALDCARDNLARLGLGNSVSVASADLYPATAGSALPDTLADLIVCNPPWLPGKAGSLLEQAVYDPDSRMLRGFLQGLRSHLSSHGEGWLILSDLAEHLGLRSRAELDAWISAAGLRVVGRLDTRPQHLRVHDQTDPLHAARAREVTSLWRLAANP